MAMRVMRRILGIAGVLLTMACVAAVVARLAPSDVSAMPYLPIAVSVMPWFVVVSALATVLTLAGVGRPAVPGGSGVVAAAVLSGW